MSSEKIDGTGKRFKKNRKTRPSELKLGVVLQIVFSHSFYKTISIKANYPFIF